MKKRFIILRKSVVLSLVLLLLLQISGCGNIRRDTQVENELTSEEENQAIQEENEAMNGGNDIGLTVQQVSEILLGTGYYKQSGHDGVREMVSVDDEILIPLSGKETDKITQLCFYVKHNNEPTKDDKIKTELFSGIKVIIENFGIAFSEKEIINQMESLNEKEQIDEYKYSDRFIFFFARYSKDSGFDIKLTVE